MKGTPLYVATQLSLVLSSGATASKTFFLAITFGARGSPERIWSDWMHALQTRTEQAERCVGRVKGRAWWIDVAVWYQEMGGHGG
eukprot:6210829-Pleurochrysis_carterae.AAC.1